MNEQAGEKKRLHTHSRQVLWSRQWYVTIFRNNNAKIINKSVFELTHTYTYTRALSSQRERVEVEFGAKITN